MEQPQEARLLDALQPNERRVLRLSTHRTTKEIADELELTVHAVYQIRYKLRAKGYALPKSVSVKTRVLLMFKKGMKPREIARIVDRGISTIYEYRHKWYKSGRLIKRATLADKYRQLAREGKSLAEIKALYPKANTRDVMQALRVAK